MSLEVQKLGRQLVELERRLVELERRFAGAGATVCKSWNDELSSSANKTKSAKDELGSGAALQVLTILSLGQTLITVTSR